MSDFNKIIKEKVEQFKVPYNDAHWAEMEGKLNKMRSTKIKKNIFSAAAIITIISAVAYFITPNNSVVDKKDALVENTKTKNTTNQTLTTNESVQPSKNITNNKAHKESNTSKNTTEIEKSSNKTETSNNVTPLDNKNDVSPVKEASNLTQQEEKLTLNSDFIVYNNKVCLGETVSFEAMENDRPVSYLWNFGDGTISHKTNPKHIYQNDGTYSITLTLIDRQTGTEHTSFQEDVVTILAKPVVDFTYSEESKKHDDNKLKYPYTHFKIKDVKSDLSYTWNFGNGETSSSPKPKTIHKKANNYTVKLTAKNYNGCITEIEKNIYIKNNFALYAPSGLRTNPDNPENKIFMPKALLEWDIPFEMIITNNLGKTIYKTSDKNEGWNGSVNNSGQQVEEGVYFWKIITKDAQNKAHYHKGEIILIK